MLNHFVNLIMVVIISSLLIFEFIFQELLMLGLLLLHQRTWSTISWNLWSVVCVPKLLSCAVLLLIFKFRIKFINSFLLISYLFHHLSHNSFAWIVLAAANLLQNFVFVLGWHRVLMITSWHANFREVNTFGIIHFVEIKILSDNMGGQ